MDQAMQNHIILFIKGLAMMFVKAFLSQRLKRHKTVKNI